MEHQGEHPYRLQSVVLISWTQSKDLLSTTVDAHNDFVKTLLVIPDAQLLVSGGSDKIVRFWFVRLRHPV